MSGDAGWGEMTNVECRMTKSQHPRCGVTPLAGMVVSAAGSSGVACERRRDLQSRSEGVCFTGSVPFSEGRRRQARLQISPTLGGLICEAGRAKHRGVLQPAVAFLSQPAGGESFDLPKQGVFSGCEAVGVEGCGASVLLSASRLAGESGSRLPQSTALRREAGR